MAVAEEERQDMQQLEGVEHWGCLDREGVGHLDQEAGQVEVPQAAAEVQPQLPVVEEEVDLVMINRK